MQQKKQDTKIKNNTAGIWNPTIQNLEIFELHFLTVGFQMVGL